MKIIHQIDKTREILNSVRLQNKSIGLVPTMGALHEGHLSLIRRSVAENDYTVVSIYVNPLQFGANEDLDQYPRTLKRDAKLAKDAGADLIFNPDPAEMTDNMLTFVDSEKLQDNLCGAKRPGHFRGVCTIVAKLFNIVQPQRAYFGQKDIQQFVILQRMVKDLNFDIKMIACPIVRESGGLALSSRNEYLSTVEWQDAHVISRSLDIAERMFKRGETSAARIIERMTQEIEKIPTAKIDYLSIVDRNMQNVKTINVGDIIALAVYIGQTRLIDNYICEPPVRSI